MIRRLVLPAFFLALAALWWAGAGGEAPREVSAQAPAPPASGFKLTFGVKQKAPGRTWNGGVRDAAQVRSIRGWHLEDTDSIVAPNRWNITLSMIAGDVPAKAVILDLVSPEEQPVTIFTRDGDFSFVPAEIPYGKTVDVEGYRGDVSIERVPVPQVATGEEFEDDDPALLRTRAGDYWMAWVAYKTRARRGYFYDGADQIMVARGHDGLRWSKADAITPPGDHFRVALAQDSNGLIWCVYGRQEKMESGNFDLYARTYDGKAWSQEQRLTSSPMPDIFHRLIADRKGNLFLVWMGYRTPPRGGAPQSDILMRVRSGGKWSDEINVSQSPEDDWLPSVAADTAGRAWIAWDSYRPKGAQPADYDVLMRSYTAGSLGPVQPVAETAFGEMQADVAVDSGDRVWVAWEETGVNWGKDTGYNNPKHRANLRKGGNELYGPPGSKNYQYRRPRVAVLESGQWKQPQAELSRAYPPDLQANLFQSPRLGADGDGRIWLFLRHQMVAKGRNGGQMFDFYATTLSGAPGNQRWVTMIPLPASTGRQDTSFASAPAAGGIVAGVVGDGRHLPVPLPVNHDVATLVLNSGSIPGGVPELAPYQPGAPGAFPVTHPNEAAQAAQVRNHRVKVGGQTYKVVRGDLHRHTEISADGGVDGTIWDLYRYALDAAAFDYVGVTDHNYGAWIDTDEPEARNTDNEYQWWRTQKSADLFYVPGRFVPLYGYERSINFPLGHRNIFHVRRGVFSYRVPKLHISERPELIEKDAQGLWAYLRGTDAIGLPHTTATSMGTDWRLRDDELEPVAEIYQGDRNSYEDEGSPRAALTGAPGPGGGGRLPFQKGLIWNALGVGYKMGFIASSDHFSTHISYANLLVPDRVTTRDDIQQALRSRRTYASTDNIVVDFHAGKTMQGGEMQASESPTFQVNVLGTEPILKVEVIKNNRVIYTRTNEKGAARPEAMEFSFRDTAAFGGDFADTSMGATSRIKDWAHPETGIRPRPAARESYYYVRVIQSYSRQQPELEGEIAWASPIWVKRF